MSHLHGRPAKYDTKALCGKEKLSPATVTRTFPDEEHVENEGVGEEEEDDGLDDDDDKEDFCRMAAVAEGLSVVTVAGGGR